MVCGKSFNRNQLSWMEMTHEFTEEINVHSKSMLSTIDTLDTEEAIALRRSFSEHKKKSHNLSQLGKMPTLAKASHHLSKAFQHGGYLVCGKNPIETKCVKSI